jgi:hypothetical protein
MGQHHARSQPFVGGAAAALTLGLALPAFAAPGDTTATFTITSGSLSITIPTETDLGSKAHTTLIGAPIISPLGVVQVIDDRSAAEDSGWVASAISTAFTPTGGRGRRSRPAP